MTKYTKNLSEPWFSLIKLGIKKWFNGLKRIQQSRLNK